MTQVCQATFKKQCQYPKCDCDRPSSIQDNCTYGYVLPDRCRYTAHLGCNCGAYPPLKWDGEKYVNS